MAKNDKLLLDGIIDDRVETKFPSNKRDECFEFLAMEQILKNEDLSVEELLSGIVDGRQDGGIDGFFIFINGHLVHDLSDFIWPKSSVELRLIIITCKHHDTFKQSTLDALIATVTEFFDFTILNNELSGGYNSNLLNMRDKFISCYRKVSPKLYNFSIDIFYASRGDSDDIGEEVVLRSKQIEKIFEKNFSTGDINFKFIGSSELIQLYRKIKNYTLELPFKDILSSDERYVILTKLKDYYNFISENNILKKYIFDANVRAFMGVNSVNEDIRKSLEDESQDFWLLNNGVTILVTQASIIGKSLQARDVQIVNGLQTSHSIFNHFSQLNSEDFNEERYILIKVIVTEDAMLRDSIIKATNNQTMVEPASLHATDKIQRDIEEILLQNGFYYERRKNHYLNQGITSSELLTLQYMAAAYLGLVLKSPVKAAELRSKTIREEYKYKAIFDEKVNLKIWLSLAMIFRSIDLNLTHLRPKRGNNTDRFLKKWRYAVGFFILAKYYKKFDFSVNDIIKFDVSLINQGVVSETFNDIKCLLGNSAYLSAKNLFNIVDKMAEMHEIKNTEIIKNFNPFKEVIQKSVSLDSNFIKTVKNMLPPQPWKPGVDKTIIKQLGCSPRDYHSAVEILIENGDFYVQRDGILYDKQDNIIAIDSERVDKTTLQLKENPL
jgi:hypothetical protein